ncbi:hypothetical protein F970_01935 [Acinetobacter sp. CIP 102082]|uniref:DUF4145 domain-containing protein n=1 Tax=Acinetobacter geminorum TaxID=2730922 RepID=A0ABT8ZEK5_9GAMM|nr:MULTISPECIES: DUF4145 domain-containing protein [Acinetobacter]ENU95471.1 hypothetical protein F970_01935 [Acinetobacter sp. CIP 102082]MDO7362185.1 DUF4145 domain-containing protein [Acinetobacter geminorum]
MTEKIIMDRQLFKKPFKQTDNVILPCPTCKGLSLKLDNTKFYAFDTALSRKIQESEEDWDFDWLSSVFTAVFICSNGACGEHVICSGTGFVDWEAEPNEHGELEQQYYCYYSPKTFIPPINFFNIPEKCPNSVKEPLIEAFSLTLQSSGSAANKVRAAIENLLTEFGVARNSRKNNKLHRLSLDARIAKAKNKNANLGDLEDILYAIKWLGNAGSHGNSEITIDDVFDAYELMSHLLNELYQSKAEINKLAKAIRKRKGPVKK